MAYSHVKIFTRMVYLMIKKNGFPINGFLNNLLIGLEENNASFIAVIFFFYFAIYMLWATMKGTFKFGIRIPFLFSFHPMKINETFMNSFLFNVLLTLLCSISVT